MLAEFVQKILDLGTPHINKIGKLDYADKSLDLICPPQVGPVECSTLQGLVDLHEGELDDAKSEGDLLCHIVSPKIVELISRESDEFGRRRVWARAEYPKNCIPFQFGQWMSPEAFIIAAQAGFQRVLLEEDDGKLAQDLDYVLKVASGISAEHVQGSEDDGLAQRVAMKAGIHLKEETTLRPIVNLAPYRTFAEINQVLSRFVFRARIGEETIHLALFEGDGGRWCLAATEEIAKFLKYKLDGVPIIS
jgi:hypothetical protein